MPTVFFDGDKRCIYEVPDAPFSFTIDGNGYRIYTPDDNRDNEFVTLDFQPDIWSDFQDWHKDNEWSTIAIGREGGAPRGGGEFGTNDYSILTSIGWKIVTANYPHVLEIFGNVLSDETNVSIFDASRINSTGVFANVRMADSLQVIQVGSGLTTVEHDKLISLPTVTEQTQDILDSIP